MKEEKEKLSEAADRLPAAFVEKMRQLLGPEAEEFLESYEKERSFGLRINPLKVSGKAEKRLLEGLSPVLWCPTGYYYAEELRPGRQPYHEAGLYYIQEPSAMAVAEILAPRPGERILDLCAAPGGKSTHAAGLLEQRGLLVCNEIHPARAKILSQNIERMGIANAVVLNMEPGALTSVFPEFFDGVIVDAPCSGEGMFRKDPDAAAEWSPASAAGCAERQAEILDCAAAMVRPGGRLVYSTCTFSPEEDEQSVWNFLRRHSEFVLKKPDCAGYFSAGRPEWVQAAPEMLADTIRIWPHRTAGEGHFAALLVKNAEPGAQAVTETPLRPTPTAEQRTGKKNGRAIAGRPEKRGGRELPERTGKKNGRAIAGRPEKRNGREPQGQAEFLNFCRETLRPEVFAENGRLLAGRKLLLFGEQLYLVPEEMPSLAGLKTLRPGLHVGTVRKGRLEPSHALALFLRKTEALRSRELGNGALAARYLRGEAIPSAGTAASADSAAFAGAAASAGSAAFAGAGASADSAAPAGAAASGGISAPAGAAEKGWILMTVDGYSIGWGKASGGIIKNHYPKGLRRTS